MSEKIPVRFVKPWRAFFKGDVAGFPDDVADELVDGGVAEYHKVRTTAGPAESQQRSAAPTAKGNAAAKAKAKDKTKGKGDSASEPEKIDPGTGDEPPLPDESKGGSTNSESTVTGDESEVDASLEHSSTGTKGAEGGDGSTVDDEEKP